MQLNFRDFPLHTVFAVVNPVLVIVGGLLAAYWSWQVWDSYRNWSSRNSSVPILTETKRPDRAATQIIVANLFGPASQAQPQQAQSLTRRLKLFGTFSGWHNKPDYALIAIDGGRPSPYARGAEILNGVSLREVAAHHVLLGNNEKLEMESRSKTIASPLTKKP